MSQISHLNMYIHIYTYNGTASFRMWACLRKSWRWYTQTKKLITLSWTWCFITSSVCVTLSSWHFHSPLSDSIIKAPILDILRHFFQTSLLMYWEEKKRKKQTEALFFRVNNFNMHSQNPLKIKPQWWRMEGIWRVYTSNQFKFRLTKLWPALWTRAEPTGFYEKDLLIFNVIFTYKSTQNTIFNISH